MWYSVIIVSSLLLIFSRILSWQIHFHHFTFIGWHVLFDTIGFGCYNVLLFVVDEHIIDDTHPIYHLIISVESLLLFDLDRPILCPLYLFCSLLGGYTDTSIQFWLPFLFGYSNVCKPKFDWAESWSQQCQREEIRVVAGESGLSVLFFETFVLISIWPWFLFLLDFRYCCVEMDL